MAEALMIQHFGIMTQPIMMAALIQLGGGLIQETQPGMTEEELIPRAGVIQPTLEDNSSS